MLSNNTLIGYVKDITIAKLTSDTHFACEKSGEEVADFMQKIYDKLYELNNMEN